MKAACKTKPPVSEELSARARAYWTPERRAEQGVQCEAYAVGAEAYNAVIKASGDAESPAPPTPSPPPPLMNSS